MAQQSGWESLRRSDWPGGAESPWAASVNSGWVGVELHPRQTVQLYQLDVPRLATVAERFNARLVIATAPWAKSFARMVHEVAPGARVYCRPANGIYDLWTVLPASDGEVEDRLAQRMCEFVRTYPNVPFDFMLTVEGEPVSAELTSNEFIPVA